MEKIRVVHQSPLFASTFILAASFRIYSCPTRLLSGMGSNRTDHGGQLAKKQSGTYPGVPVAIRVSLWMASIQFVQK